MGEKTKAVREIEFLRPRKLGKWLNVPPRKKNKPRLSFQTYHSFKRPTQEGILEVNCIPPGEDQEARQEQGAPGVMDGVVCSCGPQCSLPSI